MKEKVTEPVRYHRVLEGQVSGLEFFLTAVRNHWREMIRTNLSFSSYHVFKEASWEAIAKIGLIGLGW